ncbi:NAD-dependent epimerase/dehydratase family protein [Photobacterium chitinilyticum]|uniref:NAD-dependent epimerase/dehydratase family protein n=1 Tax=Photobacterium chitinilyticum TaxID=2485123 RepID=A0A444JI89_9GAMM|nr:NAD-dependent epimerase/dehydratase family protein [Photobacterium chitinilyticum]RWX52784.1 NAD-dependent epimerase/dehydratase family protein [Photobacterium chitinilyticum]
MKILIIGGTRFIGKHVALNLIKSGHNVTVFHRNSSSNLNNFSEIIGDRANAIELEKHINRIRPDLIIDMIAHHVQHAKDMVKILSKNDSIKIILISSLNVYKGFSVFCNDENSPPSDALLTETSPLRSVPLVDDDKSGVEDVYAPLPNVITLRLPMVYGPGDYQSRLLGVVNQIKTPPHQVRLDESLSQVKFPRGYIENVAHAIALVAITGRTGNHIYNIADNTQYTERQWVTNIIKASGMDAELKLVKTRDLLSSEKHTFNPKQCIEVSTEKFRRDFPYTEPFNIEDAIKTTVNWTMLN